MDERYAWLNDVLDTLERWTTIPINLRDGVYIRTLGAALEDIKEKILDSPIISNDGVSLWVTRPSVSSKHLGLTAQDFATLSLSISSSIRWGAFRIVGMSTEVMREARGSLPRPL